jgi:hypothetical protein
MNTYNEEQSNGDVDPNSVLDLLLELPLAWPGGPARGFSDFRVQRRAVHNAVRLALLDCGACDLTDGYKRPPDVL